MFKFLFILFVLFLLNFNSTFTMDEESNSLANYIKNFNKKDEYATNKTLLYLSYAQSNLSIPEYISNNKLKTAYKSEFGYGFYRSYEKLDSKIKNVRNEKQLLKIEEMKNIFYIGSEQAFISNISSNFNAIDNSNGIIKSDAWRFGFTYANGYGFKFNNNSKLLLQHKSGINWTRIDFENINILSPDSYLKDIDEKMKFGQFYSPAIVYSLNNSTKIELFYEKSYVYNSLGGFSILGSLVFEGALQRWIDFYETPLLLEFGNYYPVIYFMYKTAMSAFIYNQKSNEHLFPFGGNSQANYNTYGIQLTFTL